MPAPTYNSGGGGGSVGNKGDMNTYGSGRFAHPNLDFGELKDSQSRGGRHILNALSEIQRYHIIEDRSDEIPKEYFTLEQIWDYLKIGFKSGLLESFIFTILLCFLQAIYPSYKYYFLQEAVTDNEKTLFTMLSFAPIVLTTIFMMYISKYYKGLLTRRAIFSLMNGRSLSFLIKGGLVFWLFQWLMKTSLENPKLIYSMADWTAWLINTFSDKVGVMQLFEYYYKYAVPALHDSSYEILISMIVFALMPYLTIFYKGYKEHKSKQLVKEEYENY